MNKHSFCNIYHKIKMNNASKIKVNIGEYFNHKWNINSFCNHKIVKKIMKREFMWVFQLTLEVECDRIKINYASTSIF